MILVRSLRQDKERREDELNELRHLLEENHTAVTKWEAESREKAKVPSPDSISCFEAVPFIVQNTLLSLIWVFSNTSRQPMLKPVNIYKYNNTNK